LVIYSENGFFIYGINILKQYHNSTFGRYGTMANKNFVVHNGLTVGGLSIDAATGNLTTSGSLIVQGDVQVTGTIFDEGAPGATIADATALAIALGG
jgi:hypothetical protein